MAVEAAIASSIAATQLGLESQVLRNQVANESATVNLVRDAVKEVQQTNAATDRQNRERLVDVLV